MSNVRIALVQMKASPRAARNLAIAERRIAEAARRGARIVCLGELFLTPYFCRRKTRSSFRLAEEIPGPATRALGRAAREYGTVLIVPLFEKSARGLYHNSAAVIDADGRLVGVYRKMHIPDDPHYREKFYFASGDLGFRAFATRAGRIGVLICWDQWFPEAARAAALAGAEIIFYPTAIGAPVSQPASLTRTEKNAWRLTQIAHAVTNGVFVACANRTGTEGDLRFWGGSFVAAPDGTVIAEAEGARETLLLADCDLGRITRARSAWPFLKERRVDAYKPLLLRYG